MDFQQKKLRNAALITPPNSIKSKVGSGGLPVEIIQRAQMSIEDNKQEFEPTAEIYLNALSEMIVKCQRGEFSGERAIAALISPAMQLKSQGSMFKYPLLTEVGSILVNFLEVIKRLDNDAYDVIVAHKITIQAILAGRLQGDGGQQGRALVDALKSACIRYFQAHR